MSNLALVGTPDLRTREHPPSASLSPVARRLPLLPPAPATAGPRRLLVSNLFVPTPCARTAPAWLSTQKLRLATFKWFPYLDLLQYPQVICLCFFTQQDCWDIQKPPPPPNEIRPPAGFSSGFLRPPAHPRDNEKNCWSLHGFPISPRLNFLCLVCSLVLLPFEGEQQTEKKKTEKKKISCRYDETIFLLAASEWKTSGTLRIDESWTSVFLPMNTESPPSWD